MRLSKEKMKEKLEPKARLSLLLFDIYLRSDYFYSADTHSNSNGSGTSIGLPSKVNTCP